jgi:3'5'-cyclic nucleotide phosphodiesterase
MGNDKFKVLRSLVIDLIMATDMTYHFDILKNLNAKLESGTIDLKGAD